MAHGWQLFWLRAHVHSKVQKTSGLVSHPFQKSSDKRCHKAPALVGNVADKLNILAKMGSLCSC